MTNIINVKVDKEHFLTHALAPFSGAEEDENENSLPSKRDKKWVFSLHNQKENTHITYRTYRKKGEYRSDPILVETLTSTTTFTPLARMNKNGELELLGADDKRFHLLEDLLLSIINNEDFNWEIFAGNKCARCGRKLSNPTSLKLLLGTVCRKQLLLNSNVTVSKTANY